MKRLYRQLSGKTLGKKKDFFTCRDFNGGGGISVSANHVVHADTAGTVY